MMGRESPFGVGRLFMLVHRCRAVILFPAFVLCSGATASAQFNGQSGPVGQTPPKQESLTPAQREQIAGRQRARGEELRKQYPLVSLVERLAYEDKHKSDPT